MAGEVEYTSLDDGVLIERSKEGDQSAFGVLVERYRDRVYGQIYKMLQHQEDVLDLSQDVWVKAWTRLYQFQGDSPFTTWITRIAINVCYDHLRKKQRRPVEESIDELTEKNGEGEWTPKVDADPLKGIADSEKAEILLEAMENLSNEQKLALEYMYFEQMEYKEIAERMNCSTGTVMSRLFYGKKNLSKQLEIVLEKHGIDPENGL